MAKDNRKIHSAVRLESVVNVNQGQTFPDGVTPLPVVLQSTSVVYGPDREDELAKVLSPTDGKRLLESGVIEGDWQFGESKPEAPAKSGK